MTALEFLGTPRQSESFSDLEDHALGFACETSGSTVSQSSSKGKRKMDNRDEDEGPVVSFGGVGRGNGKVKVNEGDDVSSSSGSSESSESSDEELPGAGGVSIYEDMASVAFGVRPVAVEKDRRVKTGIPFPKYSMCPFPKCSNQSEQSWTQANNVSRQCLGYALARASGGSP